MFRKSVLARLKDLIKEVDSLFYHFIMDRKDKKVKFDDIGIKVEKLRAGLNMLDIDSTVRTLRTRRVICLKKCLDDYTCKSAWKAFLNELLIPVCGKLILHCSFDTSKLFIYQVSTSNVSMRGQK